MITLCILFIIMILCFVLSLCFHVAGGVLKLAIKLIFCLPCALLSAVIGVVLCCTILLIPVGIACFKLAGCLLNPLRLCFV